MRRNLYDYDRRFSDQFLAPIQCLLGMALLRVADDEEDMKRASDFMCLKTVDTPIQRIAARVRRWPKHYERFPQDFTVRLSRPTGAETEASKIVDGWGDVMFYGHGYVDENGRPKIPHYMVIDLHAWRKVINAHAACDVFGDPAWDDHQFWKIKTNWDGTQFVAFHAQHMRQIIIDANIPGLRP